MGYHAFLYLWSLFFPSNEILLRSHSRLAPRPQHTATVLVERSLSSSFFLSPRSGLLHNSLFLNEASKYNKWSPNDDAQCTSLTRHMTYKKMVENSNFKYFFASYSWFISSKNFSSNGCIFLKISQNFLRISTYTMQNAQNGKN